MSRIRNPGKTMLKIIMNIIIIIVIIIIIMIIIITGGGGELIVPNLDFEFIYNEHLSFIGLKYIYDLFK